MELVKVTDDTTDNTTDDTYWSLGNDITSQVNLLNDDTYRWNCATSSYGQIE